MRDYGSPGQIGLEPTPDAFVAAMVGVFREVKRILRDDGTCWLNLGDSYVNTGETGWNDGAGPGRLLGKSQAPRSERRVKKRHNFKPKDRLGIPHRVVFALQADGWYWRDEVIWHKRSPMPESVTDRTTKAHEMVFLLAKNERYFYDAEAIKEPPTAKPQRRLTINRNLAPDRGAADKGLRDGCLRGQVAHDCPESGRNARSVWSIASTPCDLAHFATMPEGLAERCVKAGSSERGCCPACGSPWARVTERTQVKRDRPNDFVKRTGAAGTGNSCSNSVAGTAVGTIGWEPSCECQEWACTDCCFVLEYKHETHHKKNSRIRLQSVRQDVHDIQTPAALLQPGMLQGDAKEAPGQGVQAVRETLSPDEPPGPVLRKILLDTVRRQEPPEFQGAGHDIQGIHPGAYTGSPDGVEVRLRHGTPPRDGEADRATPEGWRSRPPHQREEGRQPTRELGTDEQEQARPENEGSKGSDVSVLREYVPFEGQCPNCKKSLIRRPLAPVPSIIFDPFSGAATTGLVANRLGRRYVGTDLNRDYLLMSRGRVAAGLKPVSKLDGPAPAKPLPGQMSFL